TEVAIPSSEPKLALPPLAVRSPSRTIDPPTQRRPSPKTTPAPPDCCCVPWMKSAIVVAVIPLACNVSVSAPTSGAPSATSAAPDGDAEFAQPAAIDPLLPQGQAVALPSPEKTRSCSPSSRSGV